MVGTRGARSGGGRGRGRGGKGKGGMGDSAPDLGGKKVDKVNEDCCVDCGKEVLDSHQGVKCDACGFWHHADCEKVSDEVFDFLHSHGSEESVMWYCRKCTVVCKGFMKLMNDILESQLRMEERLEEVFGSMGKKITETEDAMGRKMSELVEKLEMDKRSEEGDVPKDEPQQRIEAKVDALLETVSASKTDSHYVHDCVEDAILVKIAEEQEEAEEIRKRKSNVVIFGVPESAESDYEKRRADDEDQLQTVLHLIKCDTTTVNKIVRMGKRPEQRDAKPRPMLVTMASEKQKDQVLARSKNLKRSGQEGMDKVYIFQDLTPRQREKRKKLVQELKDRKQKGESDLIIAGGRIVNKVGSGEGKK